MENENQRFEKAVDSLQRLTETYEDISNLQGELEERLTRLEKAASNLKDQLDRIASESLRLEGAMNELSQMEESLSKLSDSLKEFAEKVPTAELHEINGNLTSTMEMLEKEGKKQRNKEDRPAKSPLDGMKALKKKRRK